MPLIALGGSVLFVIWRPKTLLTCNFNCWGMSKFFTKIQMDKHGSGAPLVLHSTTQSALTLKTCMTSNIHTCAPLMHARNRKTICPKVKRVATVLLLVHSKWVIFKQVISLKMAKMKQTKKRRHTGKGGRLLGVRDPVSSHKGDELQKWKEKDMARAFQMKRDNPKMSYMAIHKATGIPYTTICERLSGRRGTGEGKCAGGCRTPRVLTKGKFFRYPLDGT